MKKKIVFPVVTLGMLPILIVVMLRFNAKPTFAQVSPVQDLRNNFVPASQDNPFARNQAAQARPRDAETRQELPQLESFHTNEPEVGAFPDRFQSSNFIPDTMTREEIEETQKLQALLQKVRGLKTDGDETDYRQELMELLGKQLDRDLAKREDRLKEIEQRAADLRTQLEARRKNKQQMLEILMMLAENPSAGLGIPPQWMHAFGIESNNAPRWPASIGATDYYQPDALPQPAEDPFDGPNPFN